MNGLADKVVELERSLTGKGIPHAFGGAIALAYCINDARATSDVDINVFVPPDEAAHVFAALPPGVRSTAADAKRAERDGQIRLHWDATPVDLFFSYHPFHEHARGRCRQVPFGGITIPVLACTDLTVFKAFFARTRDWADIEAMAAAGTVDEGEALAWMADLLGTDDEHRDRLQQALGATHEDVHRPRRQLPRHDR